MLRSQKSTLNQGSELKRNLLSALFVVICIIYIMPIVIVLYNSFKSNSSINTSTFALPNAQSFIGLDNYKTGLTVGEYPFLNSAGYSFLITILSSGLILLCTSMAAWYISRVDDIVSRIVYYLCVFSMVVPFQMVMFTLTSTADSLKLNTPWNICIIYLGFGAGLAVFMFSGFMKSIPIEIEESSMIDGCNPLQTYFKIVFPMLRPTMISVGLLEAMWVWNDFLLPYLVLDRTKYQTIPMLIQYFRGSYGRVEMGPMMACIMLAIFPIIVLYLFSQKYIIKGVTAGAVKG